MASAPARKRSKAVAPPELKVELLATDSLLPYARNSRTHSEAQVAQIAASIKEFGFTNPVLVDGGSGILAGHGRVLAAKLLGMSSVPCISLAHLTDTQRRAYVIADNRIALNASWDMSILHDEVSELTSDGFDVALLGFEDFQVAAIAQAEDETPFDETAPESSDTDAPAATKTQNGFSAFTVVLPTEDKAKLTLALRKHQQARGLPDVAAALLDLTGVSK